jgi:hypothetical protein
MDRSHPDSIARHSTLREVPRSRLDSHRGNSGHDGAGGSPIVDRYGVDRGCSRTTAGSLPSRRIAAGARRGCGTAPTTSTRRSSGQTGRRQRNACPHPQNKRCVFHPGGSPEVRLELECLIIVTHARGRSSSPPPGDHPATPNASTSAGQPASKLLTSCPPAAIGCSASRPRSREPRSLASPGHPHRR